MAKKTWSVKENARDFYGVQAGRQNGLLAAAFVARGWFRGDYSRRFVQ
jgi:hypothetical protein